MSMGKGTKRLVMIGGMALLLVSVVILVQLLCNPGVTEREEIIYSYQLTPCTDYTVSFLPNKYLSGREQPSGNSYIKTLLDKIKINFCESFQSSEKVSIQGSYVITATIKATLGNGNVLFSRDYVLVNQQEFKAQCSQYRMEEPVEIDLKKYEEPFVNASSELGVSLTYNLSVTMEGSIHIITPYQEYDAALGTSVSMPMYNGLFEIVTDNTSEQSGQYSQIVSQTKQISKGTFLLSILGILMGGALLYFGAFKVKVYSMEEQKKKQLVNLITNHKNHLIELSSLPYMDFSHCYEVKTMESLIHISEDLAHPIFYVKDEKVIVLNSWFFLIDKQEVYLYQAE